MRTSSSHNEPEKLKYYRKKTVQLLNLHLTDMTNVTLNAHSNHCRSFRFEWVRRICHSVLTGEDKITKSPRQTPAKGWNVIFKSAPANMHSIADSEVSIYAMNLPPNRRWINQSACLIYRLLCDLQSLIKPLTSLSIQKHNSSLSTMSDWIMKWNKLSP